MNAKVSARSVMKASSLLQTNEKISIIKTMNHHKTRVDQIIQACNKSEWEKSLGTLLLISEGEREALMDEYHGKADIRFGDNLLCAIERYGMMKNKGII